MKKKASNKDHVKEPAAPVQRKQDEELSKEMSDATSMEEFIKIKKLQNQILEKMLEKITHPEPKEITKKRNK